MSTNDSSANALNTKTIDLNDISIQDHINQINNYFKPSSDNTHLEKHNFGLSLKILVETGNSKYIRKHIQKLRDNIDDHQIDNFNNLCRVINNLISFLISEHYKDKIIEGVSMIKIRN